MAYARFGAIFAVLGLYSSSARADGGFFLEYGQSPGVWKVYNDVKAAEKDLFKINQILNENFGKYETAFARVGSDFDVAHPNRNWARDVHASLSVEAAALGLAQNPVVPELVAAASAVAVGRMALRGEPAPGWKYEAAGAFGWGIERRLSAISTDLIESIPFQRDQVRLWGADLSASREWRTQGSSWLLRGAWRGTRYYGLEAKTSVALDRRLRDFTQWWEARADYARGGWGAHGIFGSRPLPYDLLPRVWDRVANTNSWRELGAMSGIGVAWTHSFFAVSGGLYAGYLGATLSWLPGRRTAVRLSTYGIENSSAYRTFGQRIYSLASYIAF